NITVVVMDEEELLLHGDDGTAVNTDHIDEDLLLNESINGDAGSISGEIAGTILKLESVDHEELDYEEEEEKEERESRFTSERSKKSPVRAPEDAKTAAAATTNENTGVAGRGSYRGGTARGSYRGSSTRGGPYNMRGGMRMVAGGGFAGPISLLTSNIPPPMIGGGPGIGGPMGKILVNPNFGAGLTLLPTPGYGAPPMGGPAQMLPNMGAAPKVTLSIDGVPAMPPQNAPRMAPTMGLGGGVQMNMPPANIGGLAPLILNQMVAPPPSAMRFPPGMGPPPMNAASDMPPPGMAPMMAGGQGANWNLMVEAFLGDKKNSGSKKSKKSRRRSRSSSYSSYSDSESDYSSSSRSRSRSRSPRRSSRKQRDSRRHRSSKHGGGKGRGGGDKNGGERRVFRTGPNSFRINSAPGNGSELPSLLDGMDRGGDGGSRSSRRADRERQREDDTRDSARALGLDDEYLSRVEEQRRQREEMRRRRDRYEGGGGGRGGAANRDDRESTTGRGRNESGGNGTGASNKDGGRKREPQPETNKRKAFLAVHVKNIGSLGEAALGRVKGLAAEVGETKKVWRSADDVVTIIFTELDRAKAFMLKYNGSAPSSRIVVLQSLSHYIYQLPFSPPSL
ncbi:hypothetical protein PFISCL1PPCAC_8766, partial [Pristionchus fissidentatus]